MYFETHFVCTGYLRWASLYFMVIFLSRDIIVSLLRDTFEEENIVRHTSHTSIRHIAKRTTPLPF